MKRVVAALILTLAFVPAVVLQARHDDARDRRLVACERAVSAGRALNVDSQRFVDAVVDAQSALNSRQLTIAQARTADVQRLGPELARQRDEFANLATRCAGD